MKSAAFYFSSFLILINTTGCIKAESYCELPPRIANAYEFGSFGEGIVHAPSDEIRLYAERAIDEADETTINEMLFSFSTPTYFINPKGNYTEDIVESEEYLYRLKDTNVYADTIPITIYSFNDCGRSEPYTTYLLFE